MFHIGYKDNYLISIGILGKCYYKPQNININIINNNKNLFIAGEDLMKLFKDNHNYLEFYNYTFDGFQWFFYENQSPINIKSYGIYWKKVNIIFLLKILMMNNIKMFFIPMMVIIFLFFIMMLEINLLILNLL